MSDDTLHVPTGLTTEGLLGRRYMARVIDSVVLTLLLGLFLVLEDVIGPHSLPLAPIVVVVLMIMWIGYGAALESSPWRATLGKRFMGLRVYNSQGGRIGFLQAAGRNLLKDGPFFVFNLLPFGQALSLLWLVTHLVVMHRSPVYQAIHDRVLHTWAAAPESVTQLRIA